MSTTKTYSDFRAITELLNRLNAALITAKRLALRTTPPPDEAAIADATEVLRDFLAQQQKQLAPQKDRHPGTSSSPFRAKTQPTLTVDAQEIDRCLAQLRKGLTTLGPQHLEFLERVVRELDQSSESLYRQMARL
jgi:hypothetical protein